MPEMEKQMIQDKLNLLHMHVKLRTKTCDHDAYIELPTLKRQAVHSTVDIEKPKRKLVP